MMNRDTQLEGLATRARIFVRNHPKGVGPVTIAGWLGIGSLQIQPMIEYALDRKMLVCVQGRYFASQEAANAAIEAAMPSQGAELKSLVANGGEL